jgi:transposase
MSTQLPQTLEIGETIHHPNFDIPRAARETTIRFVKSFPVSYWAELFDVCEVEKTRQMLQALHRVCEGFSVREIADEFETNHAAVMTWAKSFRDADMRKVRRMLFGSGPHGRITVDDRETISNASKPLMKLRTDISREDIAAIRDDNVNAEIRRRCDGVIAFMDGTDIEEIAGRMNVGRATLYQWRDKFNADGVDWLLRKKAHVAEVKETGGDDGLALPPLAPTKKIMMIATNSFDGPRVELSTEDRILLARRIERAVRFKIPLTVAAVKNWLRIECDVEMRNGDVAKAIVALGFHINGSHVQLEDRTKSRGSAANQIDFENDFEGDDEVENAFEHAA